MAGTLEELWISYNLIETLKGIESMKKLRVLYMSNNLVKEWGELRSSTQSTCIEIDKDTEINITMLSLFLVLWNLYEALKLPVYRKISSSCLG